MLFHISLDLFHMPCLDNFVLSRPAGTGLGSLTCPQCKVLTPMTTLPVYIRSFPLGAIVPLT